MEWHFAFEEGTRREVEDSAVRGWLANRVAVDPSLDAATVVPGGAVGFTVARAKRPGWRAGRGAVVVGWESGGHHGVCFQMEKKIEKEEVIGGDDNTG